MFTYSLIPESWAAKLFLLYLLCLIYSFFFFFPQEAVPDTCLGWGQSTPTDVEVGLKLIQSTLSEKKIESYIQVMHIHRHLFYLHNLCFQGVLINHFLCIELPNQKTIIYFTRKKNLFFIAARLDTSHPSTDFPPSAKFIPKYIDQCHSLITILIHFRPPQKVGSLAGLINEHKNPTLLHISSFILPERSPLGISQRISKQRWKILTSNCKNYMKS